jgi:hypothetical protein
MPLEVRLLRYLTSYGGMRHKWYGRVRSRGVAPVFVPTHGATGFLIPVRRFDSCRGHKCGN